MEKLSDLLVNKLFKVANLFHLVALHAITRLTHCLHIKKLNCLNNFIFHFDFRFYYVKYLKLNSDFVQ